MNSKRQKERKIELRVNGASCLFDKSWRQKNTRELASVVKALMAGTGQPVCHSLSLAPAACPSPPAFAPSASNDGPGPLIEDSSSDRVRRQDAGTSVSDSSPSMTHTGPDSVSTEHGVPSVGKSSFEIESSAFDLFELSLVESDIFWDLNFNEQMLSLGNE